MATSGSTSVTVTSWDTLKFSWSESSQSTANNTSTITWKMELIAGSSGRISSSAYKDWSVTVNGESYSGTNKIGISNNSTITLASGTTTIAHNSDGTKTFNYSFSQEFAITFSGNYIGTKSGSGSGTLDTIPRKSSLTVANGTLGTAQTLTVTRESSSFTHTITYKCGNASGTVVSKSSSTSISWTPPLTLAQQNTTGTSVSVTFTITTYSGSTSVGSSTKTATYTIPSSVKPSVSVGVTDATGYLGTYGSFIQGLSKLKIVATASGSQGSTIKSYKTEADGKTYTAATVTTDVLKGSGTLTIKVTVTDSRGRTATASTTITAVAYKPPQITELVVYRCTENAVADPSGQYLAVDFDAVVTDLNEKNSATYTLQYKKQTDDEYITEELTALSGAYVIYGATTVFEAVPNASYNVTLSVTDNFTSSTKTGTGPSVKKVWSYLKKAGEIVGIAFGKIAEFEGILEIAFQTKFTGGILPPVLEPNTDLNDVRTPNTYTGENVQNFSYANCPVTSGTFTLIVESCGESGQVKQTYTSCSKYKPERYSRFFYQDSWGAWFWSGTDEYVLYENSSGSAETITLPYSCAYYRYLEIFFEDNNGRTGGYTKVWNPNGKTVCLQLNEAGEVIYSRQTCYKISGTTITPDLETASYVRFLTTTLQTSYGTNYLKIVRVIGRA